MAKPPGKLSEVDRRIDELSGEGFAPELIQHDTIAQQKLEETVPYKELVRFRLRLEAGSRQSKNRILIRSGRTVKRAGRKRFLVPLDKLVDIDVDTLPPEIAKLGVILVDPADLSPDDEIRCYLHLLDGSTKRVKSIAQSMKRGQLYEFAQQLEIAAPSWVGLAKAGLKMLIAKATGTYGRP